MIKPGHPVPFTRYTLLSTLFKNNPAILSYGYMTKLPGIHNVIHKADSDLIPKNSYFSSIFRGGNLICQLDISLHNSNCGTYEVC